MTKRLRQAQVLDDMAQWMTPPYLPVEGDAITEIVAALREGAAALRGAESRDQSGQPASE